MISHRKLRQEANSITFDHQPQKHVLRTVYDVQLELVTGVQVRGPQVTTSRDHRWFYHQIMTCLVDQSAHFEMYPLKRQF